MVKGTGKKWSYTSDKEETQRNAQPNEPSVVRPNQLGSAESTLVRLTYKVRPNLVPATNVSACAWMHLLASYTLLFLILVQFLNVYLVKNLQTKMKYLACSSLFFKI